MIFSPACAYLNPKAEPDACRFITKADADEILTKAARFDKQASDEAKRLSSLPGICVYTSGDDAASLRLVVGYRLYSTVAEI